MSTETKRGSPYVGLSAWNDGLCGFDEREWKMTDEKWYYLKQHAEKHKARFVRCAGVLYEVTKSHYATGPSPLYSIDEVRPVDVPAFVPEPSCEDA